MKLLNVAASSLLALASISALADDKAKFDLPGPNIEVKVTRGAVTLPIARVPNLVAGDKLWVKADLPDSQSNHLLLIVAFLRGTTNEPPDNWFYEIDTWEKKPREEGTTITVPAEAQQAIMFVAPETGGDFKTLRSAVKGKPGLFIRAVSDLNEASFEQQRIERYLAGMKTVKSDDPKAIQDTSAKLAATLALKPNADCFKQPVDQQVTCLTQASAPVLMEDGHGQGIAEALSTGPSSDFINAASYTQPVGGGTYSAYVGAVVDLVHIVSTLRTAQYNYIPAISFPKEATLNLKLNTPPSFHKPMTVIVIALPAIQGPKLPELKPHDANQVACLLQPKMAVQLEGAPLVFSSSFAHDLVLHLNRTGGQTELPLTPDALSGGLIVAKDDERETLKPGGTAKPAEAKPDAKIGSATDLTISGTVRGAWGFDTFTGPTVTLQQVAGKNWKIVGNTELLAGKDNHLTLQGDGTACIQKISLTTAKDKDVDVTYKPASDKGPKGALDLDVSLKTVDPGGYALSIQQFGAPSTDKVPLTAYNSTIDLDDIKIHKGDSEVVLTGKGVDQVTSVEIAGKAFTPTGDGNTDKQVHLKSKDGVTPENDSDAQVKLKDGRTMTVNVSAEAERPGLKLLSFKATPAQDDSALPIVLNAKDDIILNGKLTFVVQTAAAFPRDQTVEVATVSGGSHTKLSLADNDLVLQDEHTAVATLDPLKAFGKSAFGKLQIRPVAADGTAGNWTPLGTLVRLPRITAIKCATPDAPTCSLEGSELFLVQSFSATQDFAKPTDVPTGFADRAMDVPKPADGATLYLKLRDEPETVESVKLPAPLPAATAPPAPAAQAPAQPATALAEPAPAKP